MGRSVGNIARIVFDIALVAVAVLALYSALNHTGSPNNLAYFDPNAPGPQPAAINLKPGELVRGSGEPVYVIDEYHRKRHIANPEVFRACGWDAGKIRFVPDEALVRLETGPTITRC
jgi:hypothetical protein